jgi:hypothetical protein
LLPPPVICTTTIIDTYNTTKQLWFMGMSRDKTNTQPVHAMLFIMHAITIIEIGEDFIFN